MIEEEERVKIEEKKTEEVRRERERERGLTCLPPPTDYRRYGIGNYGAWLANILCHH